MNAFTYGLRASAFRLRELAAPVLGGLGVHAAIDMGYGISQALVGGVGIWAVSYAAITIAAPMELRRFAAMGGRGMPMFMPAMAPQPKPRKEPRPPRPSRMERFTTRQRTRLAALRSQADALPDATLAALLQDVARLGEANLEEICRDPKLRWLRRRRLDTQLRHGQRLGATLAHVGRYDAMTPLLARQSRAAFERMIQIMRQDKTELMERAQGALAIEAERAWRIAEPFRPRQAWADFCERVRLSGLGGDLTAALRDRFGKGNGRALTAAPADEAPIRVRPAVVPPPAADDRLPLNSRSDSGEAPVAAMLNKA